MAKMTVAQKEQQAYYSGQMKMYYKVESLLYRERISHPLTHDQKKMVDWILAQLQDLADPKELYKPNKEK